MSLREFATKLGLSAAFVSDVELGRRYPSDKVLAEFASTLGVSRAELEKHDTRAPMEDLKRLASENPTFGLAFRSLVDNKINPEDLLKWAQKKGKDGGSNKS